MILPILKHKRRFVLLTALAVVLVLSALIGSTLLYIYYRIGALDRHISSTKAYYLALTGVSFIRQHRFYINGGCFTPYPVIAKIDFSIVSPDYAISVTREVVDGIEGCSLVTSTGTIDGVKKTIVCQTFDERLPMDFYLTVYYETMWGMSEAYGQIVKWELEEQ